MKAPAAIFVLLILAGPISFVSAQQPCRIERVTYRVQNLQIVSWVIKPAKDGRSPVVVWSHGSKFASPLAPIINESSPCFPFVANSGWMTFFVETRGYGGSEGPNPEPTFAQDPMAFLHGRADDVNAAVEWLKTRPDANSACIANVGWSHGGVTALLASAKKPLLYRATLIQAPSVLPALDSTVRMDDMIQAGKNVSTPLLLQSNTEDPVVFVEGTRVLGRELQRWRKAVEYKEYTHPSGHQLFNLPGRPELFQIWGPDATRFLEGAFAGCVR